MKKSKLIFGIIFIVAVGTVLQCGPSIAGGSSDTEVSARISGIATDMYGSPVGGARVQLRLTNYLPSMGILKRIVSLYTQADEITDEEGRFSIDSVEIGTYVLSISSGDSVGTVKECVVTDTGKLTLEPVLMPYGMVVGWIDFSYESREIIARAKVELLGTDKMVRLDSVGFFQFPIPEGVHRLRLSVDSSFFDELSIDVNIMPSQIKNIGIFRLNYLPLPPCWDHNCDSTVLRNFLDEAGHHDVRVEDVTKWKHGRIETINLRGLAISIPLIPLGRLNSVEKIDLGKTGTTDSCRFICSLWNLQVLRLDSNAITGVSHALEGAYRLMELDLSGNGLTALPEKINILTPILKLSLEGNALCELPPATAAWADKWNPGWQDTQLCP